MAKRDQYLPCLFQRLTGSTREELQARGGAVRTGDSIYVRRRRESGDEPKPSSDATKDAPGDANGTTPLAAEEHHRVKRFYPEGVLETRQYLDGVKADLECLLNACSSTEPGLDPEDFEDEGDRPEFLDFPQIQSSVLNYGLAGFTGQTSDRARDRSLESQVRWAIECFEPRISLTSVRSRISTDGHTGGGEGRVVTLEIRGDLRADPVPLHLVTEFDCQTGRCEVAEA